MVKYILKHRSTYIVSTEDNMKMGKNKIRMNNGYSLNELIVALFISSFVSSLSIPVTLNWMRIERINSYTRELYQYITLIRRESRRRGSSCNFDVKTLSSSEIGSGYSVSCIGDLANPNGVNSTKAKLIRAPKIQKGIFQQVSSNFSTTPNGRLAGKKSIVILIGSRNYNSGVKMLNCLVINHTSGILRQGKYNAKLAQSLINASELKNNNSLKSTECKNS